MDGPIDIELVCELLRDPEIDVQNKAIDVVIRANDPDTMQVPDRRCSRTRTNTRAAPRSKCSTRSARRSRSSTCWKSIADDDWWVRSRAADALGKIGGPKVVEAVLAAGRRRGRGHPSRRDRDPQPDQGRSRRQPPDRGHQGQGLVGQRARRRRAGRNRQQEGGAAAASRCCSRRTRAVAADGRARARQARRPQGHRAGAADCSTGRRRRSSVEAISALAKLADERRPTACALHPAAGAADQRPDDADPAGRDARAATEIDNRYSSTAVASRAQQPT